MTSCQKWLLYQVIVILASLAMVVLASNPTLPPRQPPPPLAVPPDATTTAPPPAATFHKSQTFAGNINEANRLQRRDSVRHNGRIPLHRTISHRLQRQQSILVPEEFYHPLIQKYLDKRETKPHSAPYVVSIQQMTPNDGMVHYCAGTIINEHWILTAAHCLEMEQTVMNSVIVAGAHDIHAVNGEEANNVQMRNIDYYVIHGLYLGGVNPYDIALLYTNEALEFNEFVQAAELPEQDEPADYNDFGTLYGWGNISMTAVPTFPHKLQESIMPILDLELCEQLMAASGYTIHETNLCTGPLTGGNSICTADSGGPLIHQNGKVIIGIVSWGKIPCGQRNAPSVFVRVSAFTNWINQIIATATHIE